VAEADQRWERIGETVTANYTAPAVHGVNTMFRVAGVGVIVGPWAEVTYSEFSDYMWNAASGTAMWTTDPTLMWG
jgi:hypothetical protein